jgi:hypothetical protein
MYLVKALVEARVVDISGETITLSPNQTFLAPESSLSALRNNPASFDILAINDAVGVLSKALDIASGDDGVDLQTVTGLTAAESAGVLHKTVLTMTGMEIAVTDALAYASQKLFDFPEGRILILGAVGSIQWATTSAQAGTINDDASLTWSLGSAAASNIVLSGAMIDQLPKTTKVLSADIDVLNTESNAALAAAAQFDGTGTPLAAYLNVGFETNTQIDANGTLEATGEIVIHWIHLGDY